MTRSAAGAFEYNSDADMVLQYVASNITCTVSTNPNRVPGDLTAPSGSATIYDVIFFISLASAGTANATQIAQRLNYRVSNGDQIWIAFGAAGAVILYFDEVSDDG